MNRIYLLTIVDTRDGRSRVFTYPPFKTGEACYSQEAITMLDLYRSNVRDLPATTTITYANLKQGLLDVGIIVKTEKFQQNKLSDDWYRPLTRQQVRDEITNKRGEA